MLFPASEYKIVVVGLDNAGKTTTLYKLHLGEVVNTSPTIGSNVEEVVYKNIRFEVSDNYVLFDPSLPIACWLYSIKHSIAIRRSSSYLTSNFSRTLIITSGWFWLSGEWSEIMLKEDKFHVETLLQLLSWITFHSHTTGLVIFSIIWHTVDDVNLSEDKIYICSITFIFCSSKAKIWWLILVPLAL